MDGVKITKLPKAQVRCEVTVPHDVVEKLVPRALAHIGKEVELKGFRKGTAPANLVRAQVGEMKVLQEASFLAIEERYAAIIKEQKLRTIGEPQVEITKIAPGNPLCFTVVVAVYPAVALPDYKKIAAHEHAQRKPVEIKDEEVSGALEWLRESREKKALADRPAKSGDAVEIDFETRVGDVKVEGGESRNHPLVLGKNKFAKGFDEQLFGMRAGEQKEFALDIPVDHGNALLRGKHADFAVKMKSVFEREVPELTDEFARSLGAFPSKDTLVESVRASMRMEKEAADKEVFRKALIQKIAAAAKADIADVLVERELEKILQEMEQSAKEYGLLFAQYLSHLKKTKEQLREELRPQAQERVKIALVLAEIAKAENVSVSEEEVKTRIEKILTGVLAGKDPDPDLLFEYVSGILRNEKVFELLEKGNKEN